MVGISVNVPSIIHRKVLTGGLTISGTSTTADGLVLMQDGINEGRPFYSVKIPVAFSTAAMAYNYAPEYPNWLLILYVNLTPTEIWTNSSESIEPPLTGWSVGEMLSSPAPTLSY